MSATRRNHIKIPDDPSGGVPLFIDLVLLLIFPLGTLLGGYLLFKRAGREILCRKYKDYRHYAAIIGDRPSISIREIANRLGKPTLNVASDLQDMINENMIDSRAFIDRNTMTLHLQDDYVETEFASTSPRVKTPSRTEKTVEEAPTPKSAPTSRNQTSAVDFDDFEARLKEIRRLNDEIENPVVSERIDRIGALTASIFSVLREKPEHMDEVRKFMNYYLPTTFKLLKSYSLMEKQSYQGENIQASRRKIEDVLETLVHAFERQQDRLFQSEALDVETDINVLETMLSADGLTGEGRGLRI